MMTVQFHVVIQQRYNGEWRDMMLVSDNEKIKKSMSRPWRGPFAKHFRVIRRTVIEEVVKSSAPKPSKACVHKMCEIKKLIKDLK